MASLRRSIPRPFKSLLCVASARALSSQPAASGSGVAPPKPSLPEGYMPPTKWAPKELGGKMGAMNKPTAGARFERDLPKGEHSLQLHSMGTPNGKL